MHAPFNLSLFCKQLCSLSYSLPFPNSQPTSALWGLLDQQLHVMWRRGVFSLVWVGISPLPAYLQQAATCTEMNEGFKVLGQRVSRYSTQQNRLGFPSATAMQVISRSISLRHRSPDRILSKQHPLRGGSRPKPCAQISNSDTASLLLN